MSIIGLPDTEKMFKKSHHRKNDSGELDVFEAAKYFSGANEIFTYTNGSTTTTSAQKVGKDHQHQDKQQASRFGRLSLDTPMMRSSSNIPSQNLVMDKQIIKEKKKHKQPSSPGGKLAYFLNSLFNQTSSRKKKSKSTTTTQSIKDEDQSPAGWRRKRRSSISHFQSTKPTVDSKSACSHSSSGFRTPPPYSYTPAKSYKDLRSYSDHQQIISFSKQLGDRVKSASAQNGVYADKKHNLDYAWLDDNKLTFVDQNHQSYKNNVNRGVVSEKNQANNWADADRYLPEEKEFRDFNDADDGADSDSSSDLFELPNYDLDCYSSGGLPVYETTNMDSIKRSAPITSAAR